MIGMNDSSDDRIIEQLQRMEARLSRIESVLDLQPIAQAPAILQAETRDQIPARQSQQLEFRIGQYWMTKVGIVVLAIGMVFLLTLPYASLPPAIPSCMGFALVAVMVVLARVWWASYNYVARFLLGGAMLLLYFATLRLSFFGVTPAIADRTIVTALLTVVVIANTFVAIRIRSAHITGICMLLGAITALLNVQPVFIFLMLTVISAFTFFIIREYSWRPLLFVGIGIVFLSHLLWLLGNPIAGHPIKVVLTHQWNVIFILLYSACFAAVHYFRSRELKEDALLLLSTFLLSGASYGTFLLATLSQKTSAAGVWHGAESIFFLSLAALFWIREHSKYSTFFYSMTGYMALSIVFLLEFALADATILLGVQSLVVISTALWFRSKFIIVANFFIYIMIVAVHTMVTGATGAVSLSYGIVALLSARIMNWQKERLELNTQAMRNAYLVCGFVIIPYVTMHLVPHGYIAIAWIAIAIVYYVLGRVLSSNKYRLMALGTLLLTVGYVFVIAVISFEPVYRILSFLALGLVLLVISIIYFRVGKRASLKEEKDIG